MRNRRNLWIIVLVVIVGLLVISGVRGYNGMVTKSETVDEQWSNVENSYQRRADLIPNLVNTVKGYADFESKTLTAVIEARAKATSVQIDPKNMTAENMKQYQEAQAGLTSTLSRLMVVVEQYPNLKANQNFLDLQAQLEGTENRIATERRKFNELARDYNVFIKRFPKNIWAGLFNFDKKPYFEATEGAEKAPEVKF
jgi:LemA protein